MPGPQVAKLKNASERKRGRHPEGKRKQELCVVRRGRIEGNWDTGGEDVWTDCCLGTFRWR